MIENQGKDLKEEKMRRIGIIVIAVICVLSIVISLVLSLIDLTSTNKPEEDDVKEIVEFSTIFDNKLNTQNYEIMVSDFINEEEDLVFTNYSLEESEENEYEINIRIPAININNENAIKINEEIEDIFKDKAMSIIQDDTEMETIYTVEYSAYINSNILSLVIKSGLREGNNAQRAIVMAYNYNLSTNTQISFDEIIQIENLDETNIKDEIVKVVTENSKQNEGLISLGYNVYKRDLSSTIYNIENISNFFYGPSGVVYIIFAYGNNNYTNELDVVPVK